MSMAAALGRYCEGTLSGCTRPELSSTSNGYDGRNEKWKANITGEIIFKKDFWGHETICFMQSIEGIPPKVWDEIIDATLQFMKETMWKPGCGVLSDDEDNTRALSDDDGDEFTDLMTYR
ncbi:hypothetical protein BU15DRAFT_64685 [Melanogaster broomeanus]|nr:hypothetical protein BU15DRAFT_64685 [Melanogaster broomeanus]